MRRVVIDNCAIDPFIDVPGAYEAAKRAVQAGELEIFYTRVTAEEAGSAPDPDRREAKLRILETLGTQVPTGAAVWDRSKWDQARWTDEAGARIMKALGSGNSRKHTVDALVGITAQVEAISPDGCPLLTDDKRLTNRAREQEVHVLSSTEFLGALGLTT